MLTDGVTAFVSIEQCDDGTQGRVWVALDALQFTDGIMDVVCRKSVQSLALGLQTQDVCPSLPAFTHQIQKQADVTAPRRACVSWRAKVS